MSKRFINENDEHEIYIILPRQNTYFLHSHLASIITYRYITFAGDGCHPSV